MRRPGSALGVAICLPLALGCAKRATEPASPEQYKTVAAKVAEVPSAPGLTEGLQARKSGEPTLAAKSEAPAPRRMIVRTAQVRVVVTDPPAIAKSLSALVESSGGFISESKQWREGEQIRAALTFRVPSKQLYATLDAIRKSAIRIESENVSGQDVTAEYVDLNAQMANLEATEKELRELLATVRQRTQKAADILEVFNELTKIRGEIERIKARVATLSQMAELSTITLELVPDALSKPIAEGGWSPLSVIRSAVRSLVATIEWLIEALIWIVLYALPVVLVLVIPILLIRAVLRARRRRSASED